MSMDETGRAGRFGGPARLPLALAGLLLVVAIGLVALVAVGSRMAGEASGPVAESGVGTEGLSAPAQEGQDVPAQAGEDAHGSASGTASGHDTGAVEASGETGPDHADAGGGPAQEASQAPHGPEGEEAATEAGVHGGQAPASPEPTPVANGEPGEQGTDSATAEAPMAEPDGTMADRPAQSAVVGEGTGTPQGEAAPSAPAEQAAPRTDQLASLPQPPPMPADERRGLPPAPDPSLVEPSPDGPLPRVGPDGRKPWQAYARPFDAREDRPRVAIIVSGLGLSSAATEAAIQGLPSEVTLAFQPFADNLQQWIRLARAAGHEVLLNLPMEPVDYPESDPGPKALFVTLTPEENIDRLRWALSRVSGYVGVLNHMGSRFTTSREAMVPILDELKDRGLLFVDARSSARSVATLLASERRVPRAINDRFLDAREVSRANVDARLEEVVRIAEEAGVSVAIGQAFPVTIERIREWTDSLDRSRIVLAPISAVVDRQGDR